MGSKDYDDLLESFMENSQRVYNDDLKTTKIEEDKESMRKDTSKKSSRAWIPF